MKRFTRIVERFGHLNLQASEIVVHVHLDRPVEMVGHLDRPVTRFGHPDRLFERVGTLKKLSLCHPFAIRLLSFCCRF